MNLDPMNLDELGPGVKGYTVDNADKGLYIPLMNATSPGNGDVGRYLDSLPTNRRVVVPNVLSVRLEEMLKRRGFVLINEYAEEWAEYVPVWERLPVEGK